MNKNGKRRGREQSAPRQLMLPLRGLARAALWDTVVISGLALVEEEMEAERAALCGARYAHLAERQARRSGQVPSSLVIGGRRVKVERPRARSRDGHELLLPSWRAWSARDPLDERAFEQMVLGVSTRRYARSLEALANEFEVRGVGKSAVSERFVVGTRRRLTELMRRDLSGLTLVTLMIDGVHFAEHVVLAAVGVESNGQKHVLGLREGATENATSSSSTRLSRRWKSSTSIYGRRAGMSSIVSSILLVPSLGFLRVTLMNSHSAPSATTPCQVPLSMKAACPGSMKKAAMRA